MRYDGSGGTGPDVDFDAAGVVREDVGVGKGGGVPQDLSGEEVGVVGGAVGGVLREDEVRLLDREDK